MRPGFSHTADVSIRVRGSALVSSGHPSRVLRGILRKKLVSLFAGSTSVQCSGEQEERAPGRSTAVGGRFSSPTFSENALPKPEKAFDGVRCLRYPGVVVAVKETSPIVLGHLLGVFDKSPEIAPRASARCQEKLDVQEGSQTLLDDLSVFWHFLGPQNIPDPDQNDHAHGQSIREATPFMCWREDFPQSAEVLPMPPFFRAAPETAFFTRQSSLCRFRTGGSVVGLPCRRAAARAASQNYLAVSKSAGIGFPSFFALVSRRVRSRWNSRSSSSLARISSPKRARSFSNGLATFPR